MKESGLLYLRLPGEEHALRLKESKEGEHSFVFAPFDRGAEQVSVGMEELPADLPMEFSLPANDSVGENISRENYISLIQRTIAYIKENKLGKVVVSRRQKFDIQLSDIEGFCRHIAELYPSACVYMFSHPDSGIWLGATPELLLALDGERLHSMSLAGSAAPGTTFSGKEEIEQALVTDYIKDKFQQSHGLTDVFISEPEIVQAGNVQHLRSTISASAAEDFDLANFAKELHPTPAVGGYPLELSLDFLSRNENYDRKYYTGYFGMAAKDNSRYFVNLRCMQIFNDHIVLYAGGGITAESDPESEWEETVMKMRTLLRAIELYRS